MFGFMYYFYAFIFKQFLIDETDGNFTKFMNFKIEFRPIKFKSIFCQLLSIL